jgi:lipoate-protein ligase A
MTDHPLSYVSGSAYKIVKDRAYHHGTMLISSDLTLIRDLLNNDKVNAVIYLVHDFG